MSLYRLSVRLLSIPIHTRTHTVVVRFFLSLCWNRLRLQANKRTMQRWSVLISCWLKIRRGDDIRSKYVRTQVLSTGDPRTSFAFVIRIETDYLVCDESHRTCSAHIFFNTVYREEKEIRDNCYWLGFWLLHKSLWRLKRRDLFFSFPENVTASSGIFVRFLLLRNGNDPECERE